MRGILASARYQQLAFFGYTFFSFQTQSAPSLPPFILANQSFV